MKKSFFALISLSALLVSCDNLLDDKKDGHYNFHLHLESNGPVNFGQQIWVEAEEEMDDYDYELYLPNGRLHNSSSFKADEARSSHNGWFKMIAYGSDGFTSADSLYMEVIPESITCSPEVNKLSSNSNIAMNFYSVHGYVGISDEYEVSASSSQGDLSIRFYHEHKPQEGTYLSVPSSGFNTADEVSVRMVTGGFGSSWYGQTGQSVHVSSENGSVFVTLCDYIMTNGSSELTVEARLKLK